MTDRYLSTAPLSRRQPASVPRDRGKLAATHQAAETAAILDDLAALPDHDLALVARSSDGRTRRLALRIAHARQMVAPACRIEEASL